MKAYAGISLAIFITSAFVSIALSGCTNGILPGPGADLCDGIPVGQACSGFCNVQGVTDCVGGVRQCRIEHAPVERCGDGVDNNCNGSVDEGCSASCTPTSEVCGNTRDDDCDGLVDEDCSTCVPQSAEESICDNADDDCDGAIDEGCDDDNDDYCDSGMLVGSGGCSHCPHTPPGGRGDDCNDTNPNVHPGADEICGDGVDNDCVGGDESCGSECTPTNGGVETCDGVDNDCDGVVDDGVCLCVETPPGGLPLRASMTSPTSGCSAGWTVTIWDHLGSQHDGTPGGMSTVTMTDSWGGWAAIRARCGADWGSLYNFTAHLGRTARQAGMRILVDGMDVSDDVLVCHDYFSDPAGTDTRFNGPMFPVNRCETRGCPPRP